VKVESERTDLPQLPPEQPEVGVEDSPVVVVVEVAERYYDDTAVVVVAAAVEVPVGVAAGGFVDRVAAELVHEMIA
jgi:hypothetical protein